jgi:hypothetical protein
MPAQPPESLWGFSRFFSTGDHAFVVGAAESNFLMGSSGRANGSGAGGDAAALALRYLTTVTR